MDAGRDEAFWDWRELPVSHNTNIAGWERMAPPADVLRETCVLHYHSAMDANAWEWMLSLLKETHPDVQQWLSSSYGPLAERRPRYAKAISYVLRGLRSRARDRHIRGCTVYGDPLPT